MSESIPLEQGLRLFFQNFLTYCLERSESIPLEQGLRLFFIVIKLVISKRSESIPLEQGLRLEASDALIFVKSQRAFHQNKD